MGLLADMVANSSKAVVITQFHFNFVFGETLSSLFGSVSKLQIMVHLLIASVNIPAVAQVFFSGLLELVTYSIIDTEKFLRKLLKLVDD